MAEPTLPARILASPGRVFDFGGRTARADFWPYMGLLFAVYVAGAIVSMVAFSFGAGSPVVKMFALTAILVLLAFAAVVRRLHDVGWSGRWMAAYVVMAIGFIAFFFYWRYVLVHRPLDVGPPALFRLMPLLMIATLAMNGTALFVFILCTLDGKPGPNRYGPDPRDRSAP